MNRIFIKKLLLLPVLILSTEVRADSLAELYGISFIEDSVTIQVMSNGCTNENNFILKQEIGYSALSKKHSHIRVYKVKNDRCRARPTIVSISLKTKLERNVDVHVENKFMFQ